MDKLTERDIVERLGTRNRHDGSKEKNRVNAKTPLRAVTGEIANSNMIRKGLGRYWFVVYPHNTYRPTDDELKPFQDYVAKATVADGIPPETAPVKATPQVSKSKDS